MDQDNSLRKLPGTFDAGVIYTLAAVLFAYLGNILQSVFKSFKLTDDIYVIFSEAVIIALPPILYAALRKMDLKKTFRLKAPRPLEVLVMLIISPIMIIAGLCAGFIALILIKKTFGTVLLGGGVTNLMNNGVLWSLFIVAVVPAFCEEILFRGMIQRGLERIGAGWSIFLSGLLFGLFHFDFQRFAAQALIGFVAAYAVYRTGSIFNGMILHFMNNGLLTLVSSLGNQQQSGDVTPMMIDPFTFPEFVDMAKRYNMSVDDFLTQIVIVFAIIMAVALFLILGLLILLRSITKQRFEKPVSVKGSGIGLLAGVPGLALILIVYAALGLTLLENPVGLELLRFLGI
jgi:membrane protease YdiL (CAAX protease family)